MSAIHRFLPKSERIAKAKAEDARQAIFDLGLPQSATDEILVTIARHETGGRLAEWKFNMISPAQCLAVWDAIEKLPAEDRPREVDRVFKIIITHIETNTGLVTLTREEIAERIGVRPTEVSAAMGTLEKMKVIFRERKKTDGMRGRGIARYRLNQHVAWNGQLEKRKMEAEQVPLPFAVIEGGKQEARS